MVVWASTLLLCENPQARLPRATDLRGKETMIESASRQPASAEIAALRLLADQAFSRAAGAPIGCARVHFCLGRCTYQLRGRTRGRPRKIQRVPRLNRNKNKQMQIAWFHNGAPEKGRHFLMFAFLVSPAAESGRVPTDKTMKRSSMRGEIDILGSESHYCSQPSLARRRK